MARKIKIKGSKVGVKLSMKDLLKLPPEVLHEILYRGLRTLVKKREKRKGKDNG